MTTLTRGARAASGRRSATPSHAQGEALFHHGCGHAYAAVPEQMREHLRELAFPAPWERGHRVEAANRQRQRGRRSRATPILGALREQRLVPATQLLAALRGLAKPARQS